MAAANYVLFLYIPLGLCEFALIAYKYEFFHASPARFFGFVQIPLYFINVRSISMGIYKFLWVS